MKRRSCRFRKSGRAAATVAEAAATVAEAVATVAEAVATVAEGRPPAPGHPGPQKRLPEPGIEPATSRTVGAVQNHCAI